MKTCMLKDNIRWLKGHAENNPQNDSLWLCEKHGTDIKFNELFIRIMNDLSQSMTELIFAWCPKCNEPEIPKEFTTYVSFELQSA